MKKMITKQLKKAMITVIFSFFVMSWVNAQQIDNNLWGIWKLSMVELTKGGVTRTCTYEDLLADKNNLPRNMFTSLYFFGDKVGVGSTETEFVPSENLNFKGTFTTNNGQLIVTIKGEQPRTFAYEVDNSLLKIRYTEGDVQFYLIFKLSLKHIG